VAGPYFQTIALSAGTYFALPVDDTMLVLAVLSGVGIRTTTSVAASLEEKLALTRIWYSILLFPTSLTTGWMRNGRLMFSVVRYCISSNSPSGGMKLIVRSVLNLPSLTQWWNLQSAISIVSSASPLRAGQRRSRAGSAEETTSGPRRAQRRAGR
jgi:hypothetical protein